MGREDLTWSIALYVAVTSQEPHYVSEQVITLFVQKLGHVNNTETSKLHITGPTRDW